MTASPLKLEPVAGPETPARTIDTAGPTLLGRARESDICLPGSTVSRRHAILLQRDEGWFVTDLGSRHGTYLNALRLDADVMTEIASGDHLRFGPFTFRAIIGDDRPKPTRTMDIAIAPGMEVRRATGDQIESLASRRLHLLMEGAESIYRARNEEELACAVLDLAAEGTGFARGALLRVSGSHEAPEIIATRTAPADGDQPFAFSHSLLQEAMSGEVAHIAPSERPALGQSINLLGIHSAVCAPLMMDGAPVGGVYLDARESEPPPSPDAIGYCHALARLASLAIGTLRRAELRARQARLEEDIHLARQAQAFMGSPAAGEIGPLRFAVQSHPGRFIAGDLFDIFAIDDARTAFCIGDVSGQGLRAGILMTAILAHIRATMLDCRDPAVVASRVNAFITERTQAGMFASLVLGVYDGEAEVLRYVDAGHGHWLVRRADEPAAHAGRPNGLLLGVEGTFPYETATLPLRRRDRVILYSDGVVEHRGPAGDEFGADRLREATASAATPDEDVRHAFAALSAFIGDVGLADDTTLASIEII